MSLSHFTAYPTMPRQLLITLLLSVFIALLGIGIIVPVMPVFAESLGAGGLALGFIIAAFSLARGICQPVVGNLSDRWGRKGFLLGGLAIFALVGYLLPAASSMGALLLIRCLHGVGSAMIVPVAMAYVGDHAQVGSEGRYMGLLNIAIFTGIGGGLTGRPVHRSLGYGLGLLCHGRLEHAGLVSGAGADPGRGPDTEHKTGAQYRCL